MPWRVYRADHAHHQYDELYHQYSGWCACLAMEGWKDGSVTSSIRARHMGCAIWMCDTISLVVSVQYRTNTLLRREGCLWLYLAERVILIFNKNLLIL